MDTSIYDATDHNDFFSDLEQVYSYSRTDTTLKRAVLEGRANVFLYNVPVEGGLERVALSSICKQFECEMQIGSGFYQVIDVLRHSTVPVYYDTYLFETPGGLKVNIGNFLRMCFLSGITLNYLQEHALDFASISPIAALEFGGVYATFFLTVGALYSGVLGYLNGVKITGVPDQHGKNMIVGKKQEMFLDDEFLIAPIYLQDYTVSQVKVHVKNELSLFDMNMKGKVFMQEVEYNNDDWLTDDIEFEIDDSEPFFEVRQSEEELKEYDVDFIEEGSENVTSILDFLTVVQFLKKSGVHPFDIKELHIIERSEENNEIECMLLSIKEYFPKAELHYWTRRKEIISVLGVIYHNEAITRDYRFTKRAAILDLSEYNQDQVEDYLEFRSAKHVALIAHVGGCDKLRCSYDRIYYRLITDGSYLYVWLNHFYYQLGKISALTPEMRYCLTLEQRMNWFLNAWARDSSFRSDYARNKLSYFKVYPPMFAVFLRRTCRSYFSSLLYFGNCKMCKHKNYLGIWAKCSICATKRYNLQRIENG
jgi:hypothetical protein